MSDHKPGATVWLEVVFEQNSARISEVPAAIRTARFSSRRSPSEIDESATEKRTAAPAR